VTLTLGVDLGGTKIQVVALLNRRVVGESRHPTPQTDAKAVVDEIIAAAREAAAAAGAATSPGASASPSVGAARVSGDVKGIGIGTPGSITADGHVSKAANVPGFMKDVALGPLVSQAFGGVPVAVDNDVRAASMGEFHRGSGRPYRDLLGVFVGTGVGGGLILEGKLRRGRGSAGEIGHTVVKDGGRECTCGRRGHLEAYAGRLSIEKAARRKHAEGAKTCLFEIMQRKGRDRVTSSVIADALDKGDELTHSLIDQAVEALGIALADAQNTLDMEAVIVGGGLGDRLGQPFVRRVADAMQPWLLVPEHAPVVLPTQLGDLSGAVGAAVIAGG
jgi:glucokinase